MKNGADVAGERSGATESAWSPLFKSAWELTYLSGILEECV